MLRGILSSIGVTATGSGGTGTLYIDKTDDNYGIGELLRFNSNAEDNIALGEDALNSTTGGAGRNIAIGSQALTAVNLGDDNIGIGYNAGSKLTGNTKNVAIGSYTLDAADGDENNNVAIGYQAMSGVNHDGADANVAIGYQALFGGAVQQNYNVAIGYQAHDNAAAAADNCVIIGSLAGRGSLTSAADGTVAIGKSALTALVGGANNVAIGYQTMLEDTASANNTVVGYQAMLGGGGFTNEHNVFMGSQAGGGQWATAASNYNVGIGSLAMQGVMNAAQHNTSVGYASSNNLTTGDYNTSFGSTAGNAVTTGIGNTAVGYGCGDSFDTESYNTAVGYQALGGAHSAANCVSIGASSLTGAIDQDGTVAIGAGALEVLTTGDGNLALGYQALSTHTSGSRNIAIGYQTMRDTDATAAADGGAGGTAGTLASLDNMFIGYQAGGGTWTGSDSSYNIGIGNYVMDAILDGALYNTGVGYASLGALTTGNYNTAIGSSAAGALTTGSGNIAVGYQAMDAADGTEEYNVAIGYDAMGAFDENGNAGNDNVAIGRAALLAGAVDGNTNRNIAIGSYAMDATSTHAQIGTIAIGYEALGALTTGSGNVAIGYQAMVRHTTGTGNTAIGYGSMDGTGGDADDAPDSDHNTFVGLSSGGGDWADDAASHYNTGIGAYALDDALNGALNNTAMGYTALTALTGGYDNTAIGSGSGVGITTSSYNTAVGRVALGGACGDGNTVMGYAALSGNTGSANVGVGYAAMYTSTTVDNCVVIGNNALYLANDDSADGTVAIGYGAGYSYAPGGSAATGGTTLIGYNAGNDDSANDHGLTTGKQNTAVGHETLGANAGDALTGGSNTVMGYRTGYGMKGSSNYNTLVGSNAGDALTYGDYNTTLGYEAGDTLTEGSGNIAIGATADGQATLDYQTSVGYNAVPQNAYETRVGAKGGFQFYSREVTCDLGGVTALDPAHATPIGRIPRYGIIKSVTAVIKELSDSAVSNFNIVLASESTGSDNTALTNTIEILGAGIAGTWTSAGATDADIAAGTSAGILYSSYGCDGDTLKALDLSARDYYIYIAHADTSHSGGDTDPGDPAIIRVCIEFAGQSA